MKIHDALTLAITALGHCSTTDPGPGADKDRAAADALLRLRDALPTLEDLQLVAKDPATLPAYALDHLSDLIAALNA